MEFARVIIISELFQAMVYLFLFTLEKFNKTIRGIRNPLGQK
jgi:hypothetical protein